MAQLNRRIERLHQTYRWCKIVERKISCSGAKSEIRAGLRFPRICLSSRGRFRGGTSKAAIRRERNGPALFFTISEMAAAKRSWIEQTRAIGARERFAS